MSDRSTILMTAREMRAALDAGEVTSAELVEDSLAQIAERNDDINAVIALRAQEALAEAHRADTVAVEDRGPLHGLPLLIKDLNELMDLPTTYGSRAFAGHYAGFDAVVAQRLRQAGAIVVGKTTTPEFGVRPTTDSDLLGHTRNPFSLNHTSGGSSGGAAAALASGMAPIALGGDGGGSCRIPASCCGVVGMKPSRGLVPSTPALYEVWGSLGTHGPMARSVGDTRLMLDVLAGPVPGEPYGVSRIPHASEGRGEAGPWRIGVTTSSDAPTDPEVLKIVDRAAQTFADLGHDVVEVDISLGGLRAPWSVLVEAHVAATVEHMVGDQRLSLLESNTLALALHGRQWSAADYAHAMDDMRAKSGEIMKSAEPFDALLTPTLTQPPLEIELELDTETHEERWTRYLDWLAFTYPINCTGQPAVSVPGGFTATGLPVGIQFIGRMGDDAHLLAIAEAFESARPWRATYFDATLSANSVR